MKTIILNETELGKMCAKKVDDRENLILIFENYPEKDCDIDIEFSVYWNITEPREKFSNEALSHNEGKTRAEVTIYEVRAYRNGDPEGVIYSAEALKEQIEYNLN